MSVMLSATKGVSDNYDALIELFGKFGDYLERLSGRLATGTTLAPSSRNIVIDVLTEMIKTLGLGMKLLKGNRFKHWLKTIFGNDDMKAPLLRLDKLTTRENGIILFEIYADVKSIRAGQAGVEVIRELEHKAEEVYNLHVDAQIKAWLQAPDPSTNHHLARKLHHADSGEWFVNSQSFREWASRGSSMFWIHGKPGAGKSVLCSTVIDRLKTSGACVLYFYHDFRDTEKQTARGLLAALVLQLGGSSENHLVGLRECYRKHGSLGTGRPGIDVLWSCLQELAAIGSLPITAGIDALDECPYQERVEVLAFIEKMSEHAQIRLLLTSRPEIDIQQCLGKLRSYECNLHELDAQTAAMRSYILHVMSADLPFSNWPRELVDLAVDTLTSKANGMFRWIFRQFEVLRDCLPKYVRDALKSLPQTLDETYERILRNISPLRAADAHRVFQCIAFANPFSSRKNTVRKLAEIFAIDFTSDPSLPQLVPQYRVSNPTIELLRLCSSMIIILPDPGKDEHSGIVQFAHFSIQEYLFLDRLPADLHLFHVNEQLAHAEIARIYLAYLLSPEYSRIMLSGPFTNYSDWSRLPNSELPLDLDSTLHWWEHVTYPGVAALVEPQLNQFIVSNKTAFEAWRFVIDSTWVADWVADVLSFKRASCHRVGVAAAAGLNSQIQQLVSADEGILVRENQGLEALMFASEHRHLGTVKLLQELGVDIHGRAPPSRALYTGGNALTYACSHGRHLDVIQFLLECQVDITAHDHRGRTALHCMISSGLAKTILAGAHMMSCGRAKTSLAGVQLLLAHHADLEARDNSGCTPLHVASCLRDSQIASYLLERGADLHAKDRDGSTMLHFASRAGSAAGTKLMLQYFNVDVINNDGETPLNVSASSLSIDARHGVVPILLGHGADVNKQDAAGRTPLFALVEKEVGCLGEMLLSSIALLLAHGADLDAQDNYCQTPLALAVECGDLIVVEGLLLAYGGRTIPDGLFLWRQPAHVHKYDGKDECALILSLLEKHGVGGPLEETVELRRLMFVGGAYEWL